MGGSEADLTCDAFLGGQVQLFQPKHGFRAGVDTVLLAASVPAEAGQSVLDLGCGVGGAALCVAARVAGVRLTGVEMQPDYAALAVRNAQANGAAMKVVTADIADLPKAVTAQRFNHVIVNPPYFDRTHGAAARDPGRELAHGGSVGLETWIKVASKRLAPQGMFHIIQRIEQLPQVLSAVSILMGDVTVLPIVSRAGRPPERFILRARKGGRGPFELSAPLVMHRKAAHEDGPKDYSEAVDGVLRHGAALHF